MPESGVSVAASSPPNLRAAWIALTLLTLFALADAAWLAALQADYESFGTYCKVAEGFDCAPALRSRFGRIFGISVSHYAIATYLYFLALVVQAMLDAAHRDRNLLLLSLLACAGTVFCMRLAYISAFVLKAWCPYCLLLQLVTPLIAAFALYLFAHRRSPVREILQREKESVTRDPRVAVGLFVVIVLVVAGLPLTYEYSKKQLLESEPRLAAMLDGRYDRHPKIASLIAGRPFHGREDAAVTIVEFADFTCPICREAQIYFEDLLATHDLKIVFIPYPSSKECNPSAEKHRPGACLAAAVAKYAERHGRFWEVHDAMFDDNSLLEERRQADLAALAGAPSIDAIMTDTTIIGAVQSDILFGLAAEIRHTPSLFINGMGIEGLPPDWFLEQLIENETERARTRPKTP